MPQGSDFVALCVQRGLKKIIQEWSCGTSNWQGWQAKQNASKIFILGSNWWPWGEIKRSNIIKFWLTCQFQRFLYQALCVFSQMKDTKHIRQDFHSVTLVMPKGWDFGALGVPRGSKIFFFKHGHVAYQINWDDEQNKMQVKFSS